MTQNLKNLEATGNTTIINKTERQNFKAPQPNYQQHHIISKTQRDNPLLTNL